jgi:hypothetical protein
MVGSREERTEERTEERPPWQAEVERKQIHVTVPQLATAASFE